MKCKTHGENRKLRVCRECRKIYARQWRKTVKGILCTFRHNEKIKYSQMERAKGVVYVQVRKGKLPKPELFDCVDCGEEAKHWEHRDYLKPLQVEPVCPSCNSKRGPGLNKMLLE